MSMPARAYLGPYAQWLVSPDEIEGRYFELAAVSEPFPLQDNIRSGNPPEVEVDGRTRHQLAIMPRERRPGHPVRVDISNYGEEYVEDLREVPFAADIAWFEAAFRAELAELAAHFGRPPTFHWGFVYYS